VMRGENGNDYLYGGDGNDSLLGRNGSDTLVGGNGSDTFSYYSASDGGDTITDFSTTQDFVSLGVLFTALGIPSGSVVSGGYLQFTPSGTDTLMYVDINGSATAGGVTLMATMNNVTASQMIVGTNVFV
jgi:Ca2+-binding RTX toxin-like protein